MSRPLEGRIALVTGAGTRLGQAVALGLAEAGATVAVHHFKSAGGAAETVRLARVDGNRAEAFSADLRQDDQVERLLREVSGRLGPVSILVNSAAAWRQQALSQTSTATLDELWALNARAPFLLARAVAPTMLAQGRGDIVNVLDVGGALRPWRRAAAYCMSKAALATLTQCLALELAPSIRVNAVAPGTVLPQADLSPEALATLQERIPQGRLGEPADVVAAVRFLICGPSYVTGQVLAVDGGRSLA